ncbi:hypothetical protein M8J75_003269 [Diaphorina citri]|nr:hypothetical protein M8J75_003269 [Diaphorina citri]
MQPLDDVQCAGEEDEEWSKNVAGEEEGSKEDRQSNDEKTSSPKPPSSKDETDPEASPAGYQSEDEPARRSSPVSDGARTDSGSEAKSPDLPKVRLNTNLATDPARNTPSARSASPRQSPTRSVRSGSEGKVSVKTERMVSPKTPIIPSPAELEYMASLQSLPTALQSAIAAGRLFFPGNADPRTKIDIPEVRQGPVYTCVPCGIRFSSASTLEAHQTYYCSHRVQKNKEGGDSDAEESTTPIKPPHTPSGEDTPSGGDGTRSPRIGKAHRCPHCSYSADKKVSLNRHMRMHSASPPTIATGPGPIPQNSNSSDVESDISSRHLVDRYCTDCDIRFSSLKTFRAHKLHYCSTRHVIKNVIGKPPSSPTSPTEAKLSPGGPGPSEPSQPFLALPTNPILIVPYSLFQNASILSGPVTMGLPSQDMACLLLPDGTLQPMAQGILNSSAPGSAPSIQNKQRIATPSDVSQQAPKEVSPNSEPQATNMSSKPSSNNGHHPIKSSNMRNGTPGPLDLTTHRSGVEAGDMCEDEKENRRSVENHSVETEDIVCAPSIPLLLSTSSTCSSPSPAPISPCSNSSQKREGQSNSSSPRSGTSPPAKLRRPYNGMKMKEVEVKRRRMDSGSLSQPGFAPVGFDVPNLFLAAVAAQQDLKSDLPFPPELLPHLAASVSPRLSLPKNAKLPPGLLPGLQNLLPRGGAEIVNPATLLPMLNPELALRISAGELPNVSQTPPLVVKQGVSKCQECNIVFCKLENYLAHKKHYCSARQSAESSVKEESQPPTSQMKPSPSPPSPATSVSPKPTTPHLQFICTACGVKFMSYDSLTAHQTYYCNKKPIVPSSSSQDGSDKSNRKSPKFKQELPGVGWKCPCCNVISTSTCAAQKHMESHKNVKAFLCKICSYKGNTLRGMRTHIRMHFETRSADVVEDNFITCLLDDPAVNNNNECTDISKPSLRQSIGENLNNNDIDMPPESINVNGIIRSNKKKFDDVTLDDEERRVENNIKKEVIDAEEYIDVDEDSDCHVENNCKLNPSSPNVENTLDLTRSNSESHVKFEPDVVARLQNEVSVKKENLGPENVRMEAESDEQSRYCTTCDITFNYASSLIAHKKFYCPKLKV